MKVTTALLALLLVAFADRPLSAQQDDRTPTAGAEAEVEAAVKNSGLIEALESLAHATAPELERTMEQLSGTLKALGDRVARDPELRASAVRAGGSLIDVAQILIVEQSNTLRDVLREAAERLDEISTDESQLLQRR